MEKIYRKVQFWSLAIFFVASLVAVILLGINTPKNPLDKYYGSKVEQGTFTTVSKFSYSSADISAHLKSLTQGTLKIGSTAAIAYKVNLEHKYGSETSVYKFWIVIKDSSTSTSKKSIDVVVDVLQQTVPGELKNIIAIEKQLKNKSAEDIKAITTITGSTAAQTTADILGATTGVIKKHYNMDPIASIFGDGYTLSNDLTPAGEQETTDIDVNGTIIKVNITSAIKVTGTSTGYILKGKAERTGGKGPDADSTYNPTVDAEIAVDSTGKVLGVITWLVGDSGGDGVTKIAVDANIISYAAQGGSTVTTNVYQALINKFASIFNSITGGAA